MKRMQIESSTPARSQSPRRDFVRQLGALALGAAALPAGLAQSAQPARVSRRFALCLSCGSIGVRANQVVAIELARRHGFEAVEADGNYLASLSADQAAALREELKQKQLRFGAAGLPVEFRGNEERFQEGLKQLPAYAAGLERAGVERVGTWLMPAHASLTYVRNFHQHATRLRAVASALKEHGVRLGLEYVGTPSVWTSQKYPFIHTMAEMLELLAEIGTDNLGLVLDSWHWWMAGDTAAEILALAPRQIISVDLNDAPAGVPRDQQKDGRRELPLATGVIDTATFLSALSRIGYDGPVRAEPFNQVLNRMDREAACAATATAMKKAAALLE